MDTPKTQEAATLPTSDPGTVNSSSSLANVNEALKNIYLFNLFKTLLTL